MKRVKNKNQTNPQTKTIKRAMKSRMIIPQTRHNSEHMYLNS